MSVVAPILPQDKVIEQVKGLHQQKTQLETHLRQIEEKLHLIEASLKENDQLKSRVHDLLKTSFHHFEEEWKRRSEYYPDLHLNLLTKIAELYAAPPKK